MNSAKYQELKVVVQKAIKKGLEPLYDDEDFHGVWGENVTALAAEAAAAVIAANFDGQETALDCEVVKEVRG